MMTFVLRKIWVLGAVFITGSVALFSSAAWAIPSPELVVGSVVSLSQLFAVGTAILGGGAAAAGVRAGFGNGKADAKRYRRQRMWALFLGAGFLLSLAVIAVQYFSQNAAQNARLTATLLRPAQNPGTRILDADLKVLSFGAQSQHDQGISTIAAAKLLLWQQTSDAEAAGKPLFLDIRETAENEMGSLPGARHIRYPDLPMSRIDLSARKVVLFCHNGNRSSETCTRLAKKGVDCRFIVGGIEKWLVEGRAFTDPNVRSLGDLRALPSYPSQKNLLTTDSVRQLVKDEQAVFLDVRYPKAFMAQHLPGAINIPIRKTPTSAMRQAINGLPKKPLIGACYDRRSCFMSEVLGLSLSRAGHDFRGRYTVPWDYFIAKKPKPHVEKWLAAQTLSARISAKWDTAKTWLAKVIAAGIGFMGLLPALLLTALVSRLMILPISVKAERDQMQTKRIAKQLDALKTRFKQDPPRRARAIKRLYKTHNLTPGRNSLSLLFLPVLAIAVSAVQLAVERAPQSLLWWPNIAQQDGWYILPAAFAAGIGIYIHMAFVKTFKQAAVVWGLVVPFMGWLASVLSVAGNIYILMSIALLMGQRFLMTGGWNAIANVPSFFARLLRGFFDWAGDISLDHASAQPGIGNKSLRLAQMKKAGFPVPAGVVLTDRFIQRFGTMTERRKKRVLSRIWRKVPAHKIPVHKVRAHKVRAHEVAVRSSGAMEDGEAQSFAGVFESVLHVKPNGLGTAIGKVVASFASHRAQSYSGPKVVSNDSPPEKQEKDKGSIGSVLVQSMVDADYSGVLFTCDPQAPGAMLVELVEGTADGLVSGLVTPQAFRFGRISLALLNDSDDGQPPFDLLELLALGQQAEKLFAGPQDIEWVRKDGRFMIVQSRDITTQDASVEDAEWRRVLALAAAQSPDAAKLNNKSALFVQDEMSEVLPQPTPVSLSLMRALWASGGSADLAARRLRLGYPVHEDTKPRLQTLFGRLYTDQQTESQTTIVMSQFGARRLIKQAGKIERHLTEDVLPDFFEHMQLLEAMDFNKLPLEALLREFTRQTNSFISETHVEAEIINIAAGHYLSHARKALDAMGANAADLLAVAPSAGPAFALSAAGGMAFQDRQAYLLQQMGHRAVYDYELAEPRYWEMPDALKSLAQSAQEHVGVTNREDVLADLDKTTRKLVQKAQRFQNLKEVAKDAALRHLAVLRQVLIALDKQLSLGGHVFYLCIEELTRLDGCTDEKVEAQLHALRALAKQRLEQHIAFLELPGLPRSLDVVTLERASWPGGALANNADGGLHGTRVAGRASSQGRAFFPQLQDPNLQIQFEGFQDGDIIVCRMVHPAWLPYVLRSGGVICDVGGWLSHIAIVAREHDISMIVGVDAMQTVRAGDVVRLRRSGEVEFRVEKRADKPVLAVAK